VIWKSQSLKKGDSLSILSMNVDRESRDDCQTENLRSGFPLHHPMKALQRSSTFEGMLELFVSDDLIRDREVRWSDFPLVMSKRSCCTALTHLLAITTLIVATSVTFRPSEVRSPLVAS
jgi:hypothetical protein